MKSFQLKAYLATALEWKMDRLQEQIVCDAIGGNPVKSIRANQRVTENIRKCNSKYGDSFHELVAKKGEILIEGRKKIDGESAGKTPQEILVIKDRIVAESNVIMNEIQQSYPTIDVDREELITVVLSDDDYEKVLKPVFYKTLGAWDEKQDGTGQKFFLEVGEAIEAAVDAS